ncbi:mitochondrial seryl-tRNA synthetase [Cordyceps javanica]|uniref:Mitochondrial seryl-tRNA synthetase n=1 Tax=Cordyceps javanica TaxID=43265 RepID=A0A545V1M9_9HYPO|nr:mitochondrial seryl-tRNA synthetase [Cordyceps javanica]
MMRRLAFGRLARPVQRRCQSTRTPSTSKIDRITSKLPRRLQKYTHGLRNAPVSHILSFLILHELTAIVPLVALFTLFHYTTYVPLTYMTEHFGGYVDAGVSRFEKYFRRKGWFGFDNGATGKEGRAASESSERLPDAADKWRTGDPKYKILVEVSLAYATTKALLPLRIIGSVWATPWFAGVLLSIRKVALGK